MTTGQIIKAPDVPSYNVVGQRPVRHDGPDKVTGRARYAADTSFADIPGPALLYARSLRSPSRPRANQVYRRLQGPGSSRE